MLSGPTHNESSAALLRERAQEVPLVTDATTASVHWRRVMIVQSTATKIKYM